MAKFTRIVFSPSTGKFWERKLKAKHSPSPPPFVSIHSCSSFSSFPKAENLIIYFRLLIFIPLSLQLLQSNANLLRPLDTYKIFPPSLTRGICFKEINNRKLPLLVGFTVFHSKLNSKWKYCNNHISRESREYYTNKQVLVVFSPPKKWRFEEYIPI